jgi:predicted nucleic acid-binding Zn ribbon protein
MKRDAPRAVGDLLATAVPQLSARLTETRIGRAWSSLVGADVARRARPQALQAGVLVVAVDNSPWLHELTLRAPELLAAIRARFADVTALRLVAGPAPATAPAPAAVPLAGGRPLTDDDRRDIDAAVAAIADPTLATAARRLMTRARRSPVPRTKGAQAR